MVDLCPVVKWWSENRSEKSLFMVQMSGIWMVRQVTWLYHLNTRHPYCLVFRWIRYSGVQYSDGYCSSFLKLSMILETFLFRSGRLNFIRVDMFKTTKTKKIGEKFGHLVSLALADFLLVRGAWPLFSLLVNPVLPELHCRVEIDLGKLDAKSPRCSRLRLTSLKQRNKIG